MENYSTESALAEEVISFRDPELEAKFKGGILTEHNFSLPILNSSIS